ncbi:hypothetical protein C2E23DRAFT_604718 [Lenzites betulinus]|nr:hypothetical protein C2E23DRAFT_604718 [Lenzites betulinus]
MHSIRAAFSLVILVHTIIGGATPTVPPVPTIDALHLSALGAHSNTTLPHGGIQANVAQQTFPASLLLCPDNACTLCEVFDLESQTENTCITKQLAINSVKINQPSNEGLPFAVLVGPPGCQSFAQIPTVNQCFPISGGPFATYALVS